MTLTTQQERTLALTPKITGSIGFLSGAILSYLTVLEHRHGRGHPMLRAIAGFCFFYMLDTVGWFLSSWAVPRESGYVWASGNQASCSFQGFMLQVVIGAPLYSCALTLYFFLSVVYSKTKRDLLYIEKYIHVGIVTYALATSILLLILRQYNQVGNVCWVIGKPAGCNNSAYQTGDSSCERGDWAYLFGLVTFYIPLWICVVCTLLFNFLIYKSMGSTKEASWFAVQSILYGMAFCVTWAPSTIWSALHWNNGGGFVFDYLSAFFEPLACFWNLLIFLRSRPEHTRVLRKLFCRCCTKQEENCNDGKKDPATNDEPSFGPEQVPANDSEVILS